MLLFRTLYRAPTVASLRHPFKPTANVTRNPFLHTQSPLHSSSPILRNAHHQQKRTFISEPAIPYRRPDSQTTARSLMKAGLMFGGTLLGINFLFNQETRAEGSLPAFERAYLHETFIYTGAGLGIVAMGAKAVHNTTLPYRLMARSPLMFLGVSLGASILTMLGTMYTPPEKTFQKHVLWSAFNLAQSLTIAPLFFYSPALLARAGLYTVGVMGSLAYIGATAKQDAYLYLGGPLLAGVAVVALSSLAPLVLPLGSRALMTTEAISIYGGLAVFGGLTLYDVQKVLHHARLVAAGAKKKDTVNESIGLELDFLNIFMRLVVIMGRRDKRR